MPFWPAASAPTGALAGAAAAWLAAAVGVNLLVGGGVLVDDYRFAQAHQQAARLLGPGPGSFAGHWGWQHHLAAAGWTALEDEGMPMSRHAVALAPWPQQPDEAACLRLVETWDLPDTWPGPRVHTAQGFANLHAFVIAGEPPIETYSPWSFSDEPYEIVQLFEACP